MKKLDEIMELMADEMADFKKSLSKLEVLSKELHAMSIPISTNAMKEELLEFLKGQKDIDEKNQEILKQINQKLNGAVVIPRSMIILGLSVIIILLLIIFILTYKFI